MADTTLMSDEDIQKLAGRLSTFVQDVVTASQLLQATTNRSRAKSVGAEQIVRDKLAEAQLVADRQIKAARDREARANNDIVNLRAHVLDLTTQLAREKEQHAKDKANLTAVAREKPKPTVNDALKADGLVTAERKLRIEAERLAAEREAKYKHQIEYLKRCQGLLMTRMRAEKITVQLPPDEPIR